MRRVPLFLALVGLAGCDGGGPPKELLGYLVLFGGLALIALVGFVIIGLVLAFLGVLSSALVILNLGRPTALTRAAGMGVGVVDMVVGILLVTVTAWMGGVHLSPWSGFSAAWPALGGLGLISMGAFSALAAAGVFPSVARAAPR